MLLHDREGKKGRSDIIHFVGIGGIGMSGIAEIMHNLGYKVQGSDISTNANTSRLTDAGVKIFKGHDASNIENVAYVVISSAVKDDNKEVVAAKESKIPVIKRAEMLAELMRLKYSVAISGSHGKTTTTSLVACLFEAAGLDPTVINGGVINNRSTNAYLGKGDYLIAEADESDATFIKIPSTIGVITNIDPEHMDYYKDFDSLVEAFRNFIRNLPFYGFGVVCIDHPVVRGVAQDVTEKRIITYGIDSDDAHVIAYNIKSNIYSSSFDVKLNLPKSKEVSVIENITIPTPGKHNVLNALAAIAIGAQLEFGADVIRDGFREFQGVKRRFTKICEYNGADIIDDYAHHPVEIEATLSTARGIAEQRGGKVVAIFQPHRYTRLRDLFPEFVDCFGDAHYVYIADVFSAGEAEIENINSKALTDALCKNSKKAEFIADHKDMQSIVESKAEDGDVIIFMGAGSITSWVNELAEKLGK